MPASAPATPATLRHRVWDLPTRASHWAIVLLSAILFATGHLHWADDRLHLWAGYLLLVVLLFRIGWGMAGSSSARFRYMLFGPRAVLAYLRRLAEPTPTWWPGHNPAGAWSSLLLLALLLLQCVGGLFVESWAEARGPLAERVPRDTALLLGDLHRLGSWLLLALVLLHVSAVAFYLLRKREDRIRGIFGDGRVVLREPPRLRLAAPWRAWLVLLLGAAAVAAVVRFGPLA